MTNIILDAVDAIELAEILDYFMERLDILAEHNLAKLLFADAVPTTSTIYEQMSPD